ncbi:MAG TPA: response regulator [Candidatus Saccharimonadales bacterium]|nr:response regulator [Candidatus Saccharimonadales bacterium]
MSKILLIEDEPWMGELYVQLLSREHDVTWLRDGYDAMEAIDNARPDLIVLDMMLPWASGVQVLHELISYEDTASIPVVLFSAALPDSLDDETLRAYGVVAALDKTAVKPAQVLQTISGALHANV